MRAVVGMGSNLGSRHAYLAAATARLGDAVVASSSVYETAPVGPPQPSYLNAAVLLEVDETPEGLLDRLLSIEQELGRVRDVRWGPRTLDLDLLVFEGVETRTPRLTVPHPRLEERAFALAPLLDVAPWLAPRYRPSLDGLGGPPPRFLDDDSSVEASLANAVNRWLAESGEPARPRFARRLEAPDPPRWVQAATELPGACGVAIEPLSPARVCGTVLLDGSERRLPGEMTGVGLQVVVIAAP